MKKTFLKRIIIKIFSSHNKPRYFLWSRQDVLWGNLSLIFRMEFWEYLGFGSWDKKLRLCQFGVINLAPLTRTSSVIGIYLQLHQRKGQWRNVTWVDVPRMLGMIFNPATPFPLLAPRLSNGFSIAAGKEYPLYSKLQHQRMGSISTQRLLTSLNLYSSEVVELTPNKPIRKIF